MATDLHQPFDPSLDPSVPEPPLPSLEEQKTRLWALSYEQTSKVVCCENCGTTTKVSRLMANPDAVPERRLADETDEKEPTQSKIDDKFKDGSSSEESMVDRCIDNRYDIISTLGKGGMGAVYLVHDKILDKPMAIKMLRDDLSQADGAIHAKRFAMEARSALEMTHVNVVAAYGQGRHKGGAPYLVMDYIEGESLAALIQRQGVLEVHQALGIFIQVCEALTHAHTKNLIHRDIKPANVLLRPIDGGGLLVKLVDFGIAKTLPLFDQETVGLTQPSDILGSPAYMSPEHCLGEQADERSDIYSLGCVMYEALSGQPPFNARHPIQAILQHLRTAADPLARRVKIEDQPTMPVNFDYYHFRQAIESVVMRCLEKDPTDRYQSTDGLRLDLEALSKDMVPAPPADKGQSSGKQANKGVQPGTAGQSPEPGRHEAAVALVFLLLVLFGLLIARAF